VRGNGTNIGRMKVMFPAADETLVAVPSAYTTCTPTAAVKPASSNTSSLQVTLVGLTQKGALQGALASVEMTEIRWIANGAVGAYTIVILSPSLRDALLFKTVMDANVTLMLSADVPAVVVMLKVI
jgi:hypothetical protein